MTIVLLVLAIAVGIFLHIWVKKQNIAAVQASRRVLERCRQKADALLCVVISVLFLTPSVIGLACELDTVTLEEWDMFVEEYSTEALKNMQPEKDIFKAHPEVLQQALLWEELSVKEKTKLVQKIALMEQEYLGIANLSETRVIVDKLDEYECGNYINDNEIISIDIGHMINDPIDELLGTLFHEVFHKYEFAVVEAMEGLTDKDTEQLLYFNDVKRWADNMGDAYIDGRINYELYLQQPLEADANKYSEERVKVYMGMLEKVGNGVTP